MASEAITRNDLQAILNEVLPVATVELPSVIGVEFSETLSSKTSGGKTASATISIPEGYEVVPNCRPISPFISGNANVTMTDRGVVSINGSTASFPYYLHNPQNVTSNLNLIATILCRKVKDGSVVNDIGRVYTAAWTATSTNANSARVTESITLPAGTYLSYLKIPVCSQESVLAFSICEPIGLQSGGVFARGQSLVASTFTITEPTTVYAVTNMSQATTYTYTERGFLKCVRIA